MKPLVNKKPIKKAKKTIAKKAPIKKPMKLTKPKKQGY